MTFYAQSHIYLSERSRDAEAREAARAFEDAMLRWATSIQRQPSLLRYSDGGQGDVYVDGSALPRDVGSFRYEGGLFFYQGEPGSTIQAQISVHPTERSRSGGPLFILEVPVKGLPFPLLDDPEEVADWISHGLLTLRGRGTLAHEHAHYSDRKHHPEGFARSMRRYSPVIGPAYFNHPAESNAYYQQAMVRYVRAFEASLSAIEGQIDPGKRLPELARLAGMSPSAPGPSWEEFQQMLDPKFWKELTPRKQRQIQIRSAQTIQELQRRARYTLLQDVQDTMEGGGSPEWVDYFQGLLTALRRRGIR